MTAEEMVLRERQRRALPGKWKGCEGRGSHVGVRTTSRLTVRADQNCSGKRAVIFPAFGAHKVASSPVIRDVTQPIGELDGVPASMLKGHGGPIPPRV